MAREGPKAREARRAAVAEKMDKSPIHRMMEAVMPRDSAKDKQAKDFGKKAAKKYSTGTHTASETGAANLAERRNVLGAAMSRSDKKQITKGFYGFGGKVK